MSLTLYQQIQQFYDASSGLWEQIWGEHMHHGYYGPAGDRYKDRRQAQIDLIDVLLDWSQIGSASRILDVGCGIGGSSLYLAQKFQASVTGITLSPVQANRARERAIAAGLETGQRDRTQGVLPHADFQVANALEMPFDDDVFDLVWSLESGEHMPDKEQFLQECYRVLKPGGTFLLVTWCHRDTGLPGGALTLSEQKHLAEIYRVYRLPYVVSLRDYVAIAHQVGFQSIRSDDWSAAVSPFWNAVIDSALTPAAILGLLQAGWTTIQAALSMGLMRRGYQRGLIKYGLLCASKNRT